MGTVPLNRFWQLEHCTFYICNRALEYHTVYPDSLNYVVLNTASNGLCEVGIGVDFRTNGCREIRSDQLGYSGR